MSKQEERNKLFEEFEYKEKAGSAWSHNYLNQKPWHPMSYPNQRRKWIAEQMHGTSQKRKSDVEREFEKEQEFFKSTAMLSKKQREKVQAQAAVSFMYTKPPGYNAESARAAELAEEERRKKQEQPQLTEGNEGAAQTEQEGAAEPSLAGGMEVEEALVLAKSGPMGGAAETGPAKKKVPKDIFGRKIATEEDFEILKNAPREDTGIMGRAKPFGVEIRNVRCGRCGEMGHQSTDRECPMRDIITEAEVKRQQREDPLALLLVNGRTEGLGWEPKQQLGGISPPRGGFTKDDPNQQILAPEEDITDGNVMDQYGGFLLGPEAGGGSALEGVSQQVLDSLSTRQRKELRRALKAQRKEEKKERKKRREKRKAKVGREDPKHRKQKREERSESEGSSSSEEEERGRAKKGRKEKREEGSESVSPKPAQEEGRGEKEKGPSSSSSDEGLERGVGSSIKERGKHSGGKSERNESSSGEDTRGGSRTRREERVKGGKEPDNSAMKDRIRRKKAQDSSSSDDEGGRGSRDRNKRERGGKVEKTLAVEERGSSHVRREERNGDSKRTSYDNSRRKHEDRRRDEEWKRRRDR